MNLGNIGKILIIIGISIAVIGVMVLLFSKIPFFGRLPGDIFIKKENFSFYFPIVTSILISIILTVVLNLIIRIFFRR